jgi:hypothetical protein
MEEGKDSKLKATPSGVEAFGSAVYPAEIKPFFFAYFAS